MSDIRHDDQSQQAPEIEKAILGALIMDGDAFPRVLGIIDKGSFAETKNGMIFDAISYLQARGAPMDILTLAEELRRRAQLVDVGGEYYLTELTSAVIGSAHLGEHARIVAEKAILRKVRELGVTLSQRSHQPDIDAFELLESAEKQILQIGGVLNIKRPTRLGQMLPQLADKLEEIQSGRRKALGEATGFFRLDEYVGGFEPENLYIIAGRPSQGKTALTLSMMRKMSMRIPLAFFSLEMSREDIMLRFLSAELGIENYKLRNGKISRDQVARIVLANAALSKLSLFIDDQGGLGLLEIRGMTKRLLAEHGIKGVFIDYLGLMRTAKRDRLDIEIGEITSGLKKMAKDLGIFVVLLAQLNREVEKSADKRPLLCHLRDSGQIEADADAVFFIYRPETYGISMTEDKRSTDGLAELIIAKQRNGRLGTIELRFNAELAKFENPSDMECSTPDSGLAHWTN